MYVSIDEGKRCGCGKHLQTEECGGGRRRKRLAHTVVGCQSFEVGEWGSRYGHSLIALIHSEHATLA